MVPKDNLNNMRISSEDMLALRTHKNMQEVIQRGQEKDFSVHPVENAF